MFCLDLSHFLGCVDWHILIVQNQIVSELQADAHNLVSQFLKYISVKISINYLSLWHKLFATFWKPNLSRAWISGQDGRICTQNLVIPLKRSVRVEDFHPIKLLVFQKFLLLWNETPRFWKFANLHVVQDDFLVAQEISYCWLEVIVNQKIQNLVAEYDVFCRFSVK